MVVGTPIPRVPSMHVKEWAWLLCIDLLYVNLLEMMTYFPTPPITLTNPYSHYLIN